MDMTNHKEAIARIETELKNDPEKRDAILSLWENVSELQNVNDNSQPVPSDIKEEQPQARSAALPFVGLPAYYGYDNYIIHSNNTCGQAVIGSFVDFYNKNPYGLNKAVPGYDNKMHFDNMEFIGRIYHDFGPHYPLPNGVTVRETIIKACNHYGLKTHEWYPAAYSNGLDSRKQLTDWISKYRLPVAVLVDTGTNIFNKNQAFTLHWCTAYAYDAKGVYIATWGRSEYVDWNTFMNAWHCWWLPYPNNYYQLRVWA